MQSRYGVTPGGGALTTLAALVLIAGGCSDKSTEPTDDGGGNGSSDGFHAFFLDDAVRGLRYQSEGGAMGTTDIFGTCQITPGVPVTFWVDDVELGTVASPTTRITPNSFGVSGLSIARFVQSLDTKPGVPGIDLTPLDLAPDPIDFSQGNDAFGNDPVVLQAVADAAKEGGTGVLVGTTQASQTLAAGLAFAFEAADLEDRAFLPVVAGEDPLAFCIVRTFADGTGVTICQDAIDADPANAEESFTWSIDDPSLIVEIGTEERIQADPLGTTGNRISTQVTTECLTCNPNEGPTIELTAQTFIRPLPITAADFNGRTLTLLSLDGPSTATFNANGTGSIDDQGEIVTFAWTVGDLLTDVLVMRGNGPNGTDMFYGEAFLLDGSVTDGVLAALSGTATDVNANGILDDTEVANTVVWDAVDVVTSTR